MTTFAPPSPAPADARAPAWREILSSQAERLETEGIALEHLIDMQRLHAARTGEVR